MAVNMVRQPSAEPNIENIDDIIPFRYAYGDQNGYVKNFGTEIDYTLSGSSLILTSGRMVVQGVEVDIDDAGVEIPLDISRQKSYCLIYLKVDMTKNIEGGKVASIIATYDNYVYPEVPQSEDLTQNNKGVAYLGLFKFELENGMVSNVAKEIKAIEYTGTALVGYDISKGTIEQRLSNLGFKQGNIVDGGGNVVGTIIRQANMVTGILNIKGSKIPSNPAGLSKAFYIQSGDYNKQEFLPKNDGVWLMSIMSNVDSSKAFRCVIVNDEGMPIRFTNTFDNDFIVEFDLTFGYEAKPII